MLCLWVLNVRRIGNRILNRGLKVQGYVVDTAASQQTATSTKVVDIFVVYDHQPANSGFPSWQDVFQDNGTNAGVAQNSRAGLMTKNFDQRGRFTVLKKHTIVYDNLDDIQRPFEFFVKMNHFTMYKSAPFGIVDPSDASIQTIQNGALYMIVCGSQVANPDGSSTQKVYCNLEHFFQDV